MLGTRLMSKTREGEGATRSGPTPPWSGWRVVSIKKATVARLMKVVWG